MISLVHPHIDTYDVLGRPKFELCFYMNKTNFTYLFSVKAETHTEIVQIKHKSENQGVCFCRRRLSKAKFYYNFKFKCTAKDFFDFVAKPKRLVKNPENFV